MTRGTSQRLVLLSMWIMVLPHIQYVTTEIRVPCRMVKDWFPSDVNPQSSKPPYVLDVITPGGKSVLDDMYQQAFYGPGQELTYTSKMFFFVLFLRQFTVYYLLTKKIIACDWAESGGVYHQLLGVNLQLDSHPYSSLPYINVR